MTNQDELLERLRARLIKAGVLAPYAQRKAEQHIHRCLTDREGKLRTYSDAQESMLHPYDPEDPLGGLVREIAARTPLDQMGGEGGEDAEAALERVKEAQKRSGLYAM